MIRKLTMKLGRTLRRVLIASVILLGLCLICGLFFVEGEDRSIFLYLGGGGLVFTAVIWISNKLGNRSKYKKLCDKMGEHGIQKLEEEYQKGERTKEAVFGDTHLFMEPGCNVLGFDVFEYSQIVWMHLYESTTRYMFIPIQRSWTIRVYLDDPARGRTQMVEVNARRFRKTPEEFFNRVTAKNPNILLGYNADWARMYGKDIESLIRLARSQG